MIFNRLLGVNVSRAKQLTKWSKFSDPWVLTIRKRPARPVHRVIKAFGASLGDDD